MSGKHYTWMQEGIVIVGERRLLHSGCSRASNILGLPTCEALNLVTINCQLESMVTTPVKVTSVQDLMNMYPGKFDIG